MHVSCCPVLQRVVLMARTEARNSGAASIKVLGDDSSAKTMPHSGCRGLVHDLRNRKPHTCNTHTEYTNGRLDMSLFALHNNICM